MGVCLIPEVPMTVHDFPKVFPVRTSVGANGGPQRPFRLRERRASAGLLILGLAFIAAFGCLAQDGHPVASQSPVNLPAEAKAPSESAAKPSKLQKAEAADSARKRQISDESTQLLAMALSLKAEVDKTNKDTLSLNVIRKADEIERMAKTVKEKIKNGSGAS
jgi:hypothetical protein